MPQETTPETDAGDPRDPESDATLVFAKRETAHSVPEDILGLATGVVVASSGLALLQASGAVTGGTAGLSLLLAQVLPLPFAAVFLLVNLPFAALAVWKRGWNFTLRTFVCIAGVSGMSIVHHSFLHIRGIEPVYGILVGNLLAGVGLLILFRHRASLGGFNVIALVLHDATGFRAGWTQMILDSLVVILSLCVVPWPIMLMSAVGVLVLDLVLALNHRPGRYIGH